MIQLTIYYDNPFWVGVFERTNLDTIQTCKVIFGAEPKDYEIYALISKEYNHLKFSRPIRIQMKKKAKVNPKRLQREVKKATQSQGIGTKAQQAMKLEQESRKVEKRVRTKAEKEQRKRSAFEQKQLKKKEKRKGH